MNKVLISLSLVFVLLYGCSSNNTNTDITSIVPPSNLAGIVISSTQINLTWKDNSTNEVGFKIERKTGSDIYVLVGNVGTNIMAFSDVNLTPNTNYTYRIYSYNSSGNSPTYSNEISLKTSSTIVLPSITTKAVTGITSTTASCGGIIQSDGGSPILGGGLVWSTSQNPTSDLATKYTFGMAVLSFGTEMTGLTPNTTYYARTYVKNIIGTAYGNQVTFTTSSSPVIPTSVTDIDGNSYPTTVLCDNKVWTTKNLNVSKYRNGDIIPQVTSTSNLNISTGAWCYYSFSSPNGTIYGKLYNWAAIIDSRGLAPLGWHIPGQDEWTTMTNCYGGLGYAGAKLKQIGINYWQSPNTGATNASSFSGLPGGYYSPNTFFDINQNAYFWANTTYGTQYSYYWRLNYDNINVGYGLFTRNSFLSVRLVKD